ncbi:MAG: ABC transporter ATP-binding protein [Candidatus Sericytochromatia bacterium]|nr:ABC transporter ATP-binding protein [Candidatus Sericytochromatia bacterium]
MAEIDLRRIIKNYGAQPVVQDLSLQIADREFLVLVGASGCGKSTTLRMLAGLETPDSGEILIGGRVVTQLPPKERDVAMVFQSYALYPHLSVFDNISFSLQLRGVPHNEIRKKVHEAADSLDLTAYLDRKPKALSGGQRQRVALARAIVRQPQAFLMDEPLSNLDAKLRTQTRVELKRLHQRLATTIVYVTHDQTEALTMGDRIAVLNKGRLAQVDTPRTIYDRPANIFVAGFIGSPAMNFLHGVLRQDDLGKIWLRCADQDVTIPALGDGHTDSKVLNRPIILGVRPEALSLSRDGTGLKALVDVVEPSGGRTYVHLTAGQQRIVADFDTFSIPDLRSGDSLSLSFRHSQLHIFDPDTEAALLHTSSHDAAGGLN